MARCERLDAFGPFRREATTRSAASADGKLDFDWTTRRSKYISSDSAGDVSQMFENCEVKPSIVFVFAAFNATVSIAATTFGDISRSGSEDIAEYAALHRSQWETMGAPSVRTVVIVIMDSVIASAFVAPVTAIT